MESRRVGREQNEAETPTRRRISTGPQGSAAPGFNIPPDTRGDPPRNEPPLTRQNATMNTGGNTDEVPLVPEPKRIGKIVQDYTTIVLPFYQRINIDTSQVGGTNSVDIRLNSIYDPIVGTTTNRQPQGRDAFAQNYQYYRVIRSSVDAQWVYCRPRIGEINFSANPPTNTG